LQNKVKQLTAEKSKLEAQIKDLTENSNTTNNYNMNIYFMCICVLIVVTAVFPGLWDLIVVRGAYT